MSIDFTKLFGNGSATLGPTLATNFFESRTWTAPQDGIVIVRAMGAGGGGARSATSATGGYSGSWGCKIVRVKKGDTISVAIGAGGVGRTGTDGNGTAGGDTIITIGGVQYIAYGGLGGVAGATGPLPNGPAPSANWDFGAAPVKPGWGTPNIRTGGAGVDILAQGNNATTSDSTEGSGGGGTGSKSVGVVGGGAMPGGKSALGSGPASPAIIFDASQGEWGISFYGGSGPSNNGAGANGGGGGGGNGGNGTGGNGGNGGGGGGATSTNNGGAGGIGGGGGSANGGNGGNGGQGFAHLKFYADMGV